MMDIIERLWIAHAELPGRQLLMRDAIKEIQDVRAERDARVSVELLNITRETCDRIRSDNDRLRARVAELEAPLKKWASDGCNAWDVVGTARALLSAPSSKKEGEG